MSATDLLSQLNKLQGKLNPIYALILKRHHLTMLAPAHLAILNVLYDHKELPMKTIAALTGRDKSTITPLINKLLNLEYVIKMQDSKDKRVSNISITQKGMALKPSIDSIFLQINEQLELLTNASDRLNLLRALDKMTSSL